MKTRRTGLAAAWLAAALPLAAGAQATQGVSKTEVVVGTIQDLSGPIAAFGKETVNGMNMRIEEFNAAGGTAGRKIRLVVEDSSYDTKKAVLAAQKLVQNDKIFITVANIGTALALTTMPIFTEGGVIHAFPLASARGLYDPPNPLAFAFTVPYYQQGRVIVKALTKTRDDRKWCSLMQDDELGTELMKGVESQLGELKKKVLEKTTYKRGATDFSSQVARLKSAGCDTMVVGTTLRETIGTLNEAKKVGFAPDFIGTSASYSHLVPKLGGPVTEGFLSSHASSQPYADDASKELRDWYAAYKTKYNEDPGQYAVFGYGAMDWTIKTLEKVGADLTTQRFVQAMESSTFPRDKLGFDTMSFSRTKRLGSEAVRISKLVNGRWVPITDYLQP
ncbi:ABC transporter substrate-binding protein [Variovorax sp. EBFNA2]|uniref:ABC transporter substrate-binding protein n=1 Tax=Variovorax sp. EBFNA2 TaxID=3342097 RepID=UPI0029BFC3AC|nr:ABC transporter substrate-binding protein [Variovorax boronicumulans]WPG36304.1 ABC transporter substrate-binding protein [Variovorax boronicumulans]